MHAILSHPALVDCRRLFLRDYEIYINIGVHDFEKKAEQRVILNVDLYIPLSMNTPTNDQLDEVVDYDFMRETIKERASQGHIHLQETFCDDIVAAMLMHPKVFTKPTKGLLECWLKYIQVFRLVVRIVQSY
jgi:dihydroneopterin aldolase